MGALGTSVTGYYLIDSWLKDVRLAITGYDFRSHQNLDTEDAKTDAKIGAKIEAKIGAKIGAKIDPKTILTLRITSVALRTFGIFMATHFINFALGAQFLYAFPLFILSHDFIVIGNSLSAIIENDFIDGTWFHIDNLRKRELLSIVKKVSEVFVKNMNSMDRLRSFNFEDLKKDLKGSGIDDVIKDLKAGTIIGGWKEAYLFLSSSEKQKDKIKEPALADKSPASKKI